MIRRMDASINQRSQIFSNSRSTQNQQTRKTSEVKQQKVNKDNPVVNEQVDKLASQINKTQLYTKNASKVIAENLLKGSVRLYA